MFSITQIPCSPAAQQRPLFESFFMGGFECSTHRLSTGRRLDLLPATQHDRFALLDYKRLQGMGLRVAREGVRWHLVEAQAGHYEFASVLPIIQAARVTGTQVIWDLCHFGWPDHINIFKPEFVARLQDFAAAFAEWILRQTGGAAHFVPINEISFFSWAGGEVGAFNPFAAGQGAELKEQLVRASLGAIHAIRSVMPAARFVAIDPIVHVVASPKHREEKTQAEAYRLSQYEAWDMLAGKLKPELGGAEQCLDIVGVNFYPHNQWYYNLRNGRRIRKFEAIRRTSPDYRPFRQMLQEIYQRYRRPVFVAETGSENRRRAGWFRYVCNEVHAALQAGIPVMGICLYPILNHPGWEDDRHCRNGLWDYADEHGRRKIYAPLAQELARAQKLFEKQLAAAA